VTHVRPVLLLLALLLSSHEASSAPREEETRPLGAPSAFDLSGADGELLAVAAGVRLRRDPEARAAALVTLDAAAELAVLERREDWVRVRYGAWTGWVPADGREPAETAGRSLALAIQPLPVLATAFPDPEILALAIDHLVDPEPPAALGSFTLHTDCRRRPLLKVLQEVGEALPSAYARRFGLPVTAPRGAVVLFASEDAYRAWAANAPEPAVQTARGHARSGVASLFVGDEDEKLLASLLVHELTHLLNREAIGSNLPAWLEEGLATDLAACRIDGDGKLALGTWGGYTSILQDRMSSPGAVWIEQRGALASRRRLREAWRRRELAPLGELLELPWNAFVATERRSVHYNQATALVRYLLDGEQGALAEPFRDYLRELADGAAPDVPLLERALGRSVGELEHGLQQWLARQAVLARVP
jgi:hypothetical protein